MTVKTIKVDYLARVEGEGAIKVVVRDGAVERAEFRIFEPPRFFEALLRGRAFTEAPDITPRKARIVPPTSQNQASIEEDLVSFIGGSLDLPDDALRHRCEQTVRNYDPCISCSTHFLQLEIDRG